MQPFMMASASTPQPHDHWEVNESVGVLSFSREAEFRWRSQHCRFQANTRARQTSHGNSFSHANSTQNEERQGCIEGRQGNWGHNSAWLREIVTKPTRS
jgi:hypothetical protein